MPFGRLRPFGGWSEGFGTLDALRREMDRIFTEYSGGRAARTAGVYPAMNVFEDHEKFQVQAEIAGIEPSELNVSVVQNTLSVSGERKIATEGGDASYHRRERAGGRFHRSIELPTPVESGKVDANYTDGILTITLPKAEEARPRQIEVR